MSWFAFVALSSGDAGITLTLAGISIAHGVVLGAVDVASAFLAAVRAAVEAESVGSTPVAGSSNDIFSTDALTTSFLTVLG